MAWQRLPGTHHHRQKERRRLAAWAVLLAVGLAACTALAGELVASPRPAAPLPPGAEPLILQTAPPVTTVPRSWACPENTFSGPVRVLLEDGAMAFEAAGGRRLDLVWPRGFSARLFDGRAEIVAPDGSVVARDGETIFDNVSGPPDICAVNGVYYPPAG